jgi:hypothetical protein
VWGRGLRAGAAWLYRQPPGARRRGTAQRGRPVKTEAEAAAALGTWLTGGLVGEGCELNRAKFERRMAFLWLCAVLT